MNTMMLGLKDGIYLMINDLLMFLPCDILVALGDIYIYIYVCVCVCVCVLDEW